MAGEMATVADGTHPTGMLSCSLMSLLSPEANVRNEGNVEHIQWEYNHGSTFESPKHNVTKVTISIASHHVM